MRPLFGFSQAIFWLLAHTAIWAAVDGVPFDGNFHSASSTDRYGVIVLSGSGGGKDDETARKIAEMGYQVLSLAYFDREGSPLVPDTLEMIPLEYFQAPKAWLMNRADTRNDGVIVYGSSKGAELALLLASQDDDYHAVIALAPSHVVWQGVPADFSRLTSAPSSWSINGAGIPFVPYVSNEEKARMGFANRHEASLQDVEAVRRALIPVENIDGPILLLSGTMDASWPADAMGEQVCSRRQSLGATQPCLHQVFIAGDHLLTTHKSALTEAIAEFLLTLD